MAGRFIAIGDIHGCSVALDSLLKLIHPTPSDTIITLGDYVNRGPDSRGVLTRLIALKKQCKLIPLLGNHDDLVLRNRSARTAAAGMPCSDAEDGVELFDEQHFAFLESCVLHYQIETHFFVHANYDPSLPLSDQDHYTLLWLHLHKRMPRPHRSKKVAVVGHTSQRSGEILDRPHIKCIDTYCHGGGWLTAMDVHSQRIWQVNREGTPRPPL